MEYITKDQIRRFLAVTNTDCERKTQAEIFEEEQEKEETLKHYNPNRIKQCGIPPDMKKHNKFVKLINRKFNQNEKAEVIKIAPFGFIRMCHSNSEILCEICGDDFETVIGYNITYCPCGSFCQAEVHSVVRHKPSRKFIDFTKDFDGLTHKAFLPLQSVMDMGANNYFRSADILPFIGMNAKGHKCKDGYFNIDLNDDYQLDIYDVPENVEFEHQEEVQKMNRHEQFMAILNNQHRVKTNGFGKVRTEIEKIKARGEYELMFA